MNWVSVAILGYVGLGALSGLRRGLSLVVFSVAGYIAGMLLASRYQKVIVASIVHALPIQRWVNRYIPLAASNLGGVHQATDRWVISILGVLVFLLVIFAVEALGRSVGVVVSQLVKTFRVTGFLNGIGGLAAGLVEHGLVACLILGVLVSFPLVSHTSLVVDLDHNALVTVLVGWYHRLTLTPAAKWL
ncbi:MAG: CvpA family protein [Firmicutes bacterium]|nr:CvpA family protein [Bacillota bacterium]